MTDGIKKWKRHALSTQNYLMKKNEVNRSSTFRCMVRDRILFWTDGCTDGETDGLTDDKQCNSSQSAACSQGTK